MDINQINSKTNIPLAPSDNSKITSNPPVKVDENNLKPGQYIKGIVTDLRYDEAKILLENSQETIVAKLDGNFSFSIGQLAVFIVNEVSPDIIFLKAAPNLIKPELEATIEKALNEAGFSLNDTNKGIVQELLNYRMPIGKHVLQYLIRQAHLNKDTTPETLIQMYRFNIPITKDNISQFKAMQEGTNNLLSDLNNAVKKVLDLLQPSTNPTVSITNQDAAEMNLEDNFQGYMANEYMTNIDKAITDNSTYNNAISDRLLKWIVPTTNSLEINQYILNDQDIQDLHNVLGRIYSDEELKTIFRENPITTGDVFTFINNHINQWDISTVNTIIRTPIYRKLVEKALENRWSLTPKQIEKGLPIEEFFKRIEKDMEELNKLFQLATESPSNEIIADRETPIKQITDQINFMKSLNNMFMYLQLPVHFKEQIAHSELYVFRRKGNLNNNKETISALIHMNMTYMGTIDIHLSLSNNFINTTFYTADSMVGQLIDENLPTLQDKLSDLGYHLKAKVQNINDKLDLDKTLWGLNISDTTINRYTFDIRT